MESAASASQQANDNRYGEPRSESSLISRNITIFSRRTSIRLEQEMWSALSDIARREQCSIHDICALVHARKKPESSFTAAIRVFLILYYRAAATEKGHKDAGHGDFNMMKKRANIRDVSQPREKCVEEKQKVLA